MAEDGARKDAQLHGFLVKDCDTGDGFVAKVLDIMRVVVDMRGCICDQRAPFPGAERTSGARMAAAGRLQVYRI